MVGDLFDSGATLEEITRHLHWAGAVGTLKAGWVPVFVLDHPAMPEGNRLLLGKGALPFPHPFPDHYSKLRDWLQAQATVDKPPAKQLGLF